MKKQPWSGRRGSFAIACFTILFCSMLAPVAHAQSGRLIIPRAASFGSAAWLRIWIDGAEVKAVAWGHNFDGPISPGRHVIGVLDSDARPNHPPTQVTVDVTAGETYQFTAVRGHKGISLQRTRS